MKIAVCVKQVPDTWAEKKLQASDSTLDRESAVSQHEPGPGAAEGARTFAFPVGIAHHCSHRGWRRGIDRHHLR